MDMTSVYACLCEAVCDVTTGFRSLTLSKALCKSRNTVAVRIISQKENDKHHRSSGLYIKYLYKRQNSFTLRRAQFSGVPVEALSEQCVELELVCSSWCSFHMVLFCFLSLFSSGFIYYVERLPYLPLSGILF